MTYRHAEHAYADEVCAAPIMKRHVPTICACRTPTPDPASPCAECGDPEDGPWHALVIEGDQWHEPIATRCATCGHGLEVAP